MKTKKNLDTTTGWKNQNSKDLYGIDDWGHGYFSINRKGNLVVKPDKGQSQLEILEVIEHLKKNKINTPVLLRFPQILESRIHELYECFDRSINESGYQARYKGVFPLKVNQRKDVIDEIVRAGKKYNYGLEAGSKPELIESLSFKLNPESLLVCNGYKDKHYIRTAIEASLLKNNIILVIDQLDEIHDIIKFSKKLNANPCLGIRLRLYSRGSGKWAESGGEASKFGLTTVELLTALDILTKNGMVPNLKMLHFHIGSQITEVRRIQNAVKEASRIYAKVKGMASALEYFNIGGGLGVDYDGSKTSSDASANYSMQEYTNNVVFTLKEICDEEGIEHPTVVTESGRAIVVYHSMLITNLAYEKSIHYDRNVEVGEDTPNVLQNLYSCLDEITIKNYRELYHDSLQYKDEILYMFNLGQLGLEDKAKGETLFYKICQKIYRYLQQTENESEEFDYVRKLISKKYIGNFSMFQSMPDFWAIDQLFPIVPIQKLNKEPTNRGTILDITCDSDGEIDKFVDVKDVKDLLELHALDNNPYYVAVLLLGAYQDSIGDLHNLFGAIHEAHVVLKDDDEWDIKRVIKGDTVNDVLTMLKFNKRSLVHGIETSVQRSVDDGDISYQMGKSILNNMKKEINDYTYLDF
ncbi:MAG: biosynthetic arginine decarboxylase [Methanosarcinaceae archaeon]|nr:biosynthetic arginine decarboxylase [Methanosarcinaceae archaeon]